MYNNQTNIFNLGNQNYENSIKIIKKIVDTYINIDCIFGPIYQNEPFNIDNIEIPKKRNEYFILCSIKNKNYPANIFMEDFLNKNRFFCESNNKIFEIEKMTIRGPIFIIKKCDDIILTIDDKDYNLFMDRIFNMNIQFCLINEFNNNLELELKKMSNEKYYDYDYDDNIHEETLNECNMCGVDFGWFYGWISGRFLIT